MKDYRLDVLHKTAAGEYAGSVFVKEENLRLVYCVQVVGPVWEAQQ